MKRRIFIAVVLLICLGISIVLAMLLVDINQDRQYSVKIKGVVKVYDRESPPGYKRGDDGVIDVLHAHDRVTVMRIIFHDEEAFESIRVRLPDGREGYIFCCDNFELSR